MYFSLSFECVIREKRIRRRRNLSIYPAKHFCVESVCDKKGKRSKATSSRSKNKKKCTKYISAVCSAVLSTYTSTQYSILWRSKKKKKWEWFPVEIVLVVSNRSKRVYLSPFLISSSPIQSTLLFISKHIFEDGRIEGVAGEFVKKERKKIPSTNGNSRYIFRNGEKIRRRRYCLVPSFSISVAFCLSTSDSEKEKEKKRVRCSSRQRFTSSFGMKEFLSSWGVSSLPSKRLFEHA